MEPHLQLRRFCLERGSNPGSGISRPAFNLLSYLGFSSTLEALRENLVTTVLVAFEEKFEIVET